MAFYGDAAAVVAVFSVDLELGVSGLCTGAPPLYKFHRQAAAVVAVFPVDLELGVSGLCTGAPPRGGFHREAAAVLAIFPVDLELGASGLCTGAPRWESLNAGILVVREAGAAIDVEAAVGAAMLFLTLPDTECIGWCTCAHARPDPAWDA